ncbi:universal stress protein [Planctellipticum variicoloris]|uniref:universal stress protein n=1 Tax=Planctellipticum variicoloris TaxID=3064265 RepID=UPI00301331C1|nr:universal stress protein [Planctomycetaceae bacterium SH412]
MTQNKGGSAALPPETIEEGQTTVKVLVCVDHSDSSRRAVAFVGKVFGQGVASDLKITLFHVAEFLPEFVLTDHAEPGLTPRSLAAMWATRAKEDGEKLLEEQRGTLAAAGVPAGALESRLIATDCLPEARKVAAALTIIEEMQSGNYDVVCIGRRGASQISSSFIGGVAEKILREAAGRTVWVVDEPHV